MSRNCLVAAVVLTAALGAAPAAGPIDAGPWTARLEKLNPDDPMAYFELAEEIADGSSQPDLAQHLFALAGVLDPQRLGRSACLALADLEENPHVKRRLLALAALLDERAGGLMAGPPGDAGGHDRASVLAVTDALSYYRTGNGAKATAALHGSGARAILDTYGSVFRSDAARFLEDCRLYRGSHRPVIDEQDGIVLLRFEAALLEGEDRSWSGELLLTGGRPLIEVDPDRLEESFGVNGALPYFRDGRWEGTQGPFSRGRR